MKRNSRRVLTVHKLMLLLVMLITGVVTQAQTPSAFTYQGRLTDAGAPANGAFDLEFKLFDGSGAQIGSAEAREDVTVTNGVFLVRLDFGVSPFSPGATASTLEIGVRPGASTGAYTTLSPRQPITATPYAVQTINAEMLGGVPASEYVKTDDPRLTDGGPPGPGSNHYIQNQTATQQPNVGFNIGGNGLFGGQVVAGGGLLVSTGNGFDTQIGTPNSTTGMSLKKPGFGRADLRFDGARLNLTAGPDAGPPAAINGVTVTTDGHVGIGTDTTFTGKLTTMTSGQPAIYAESNNRGVWAKSTGSSYGVYGESGSGIGMQGVSTSNIGVGGISTSHIAVAGTSVSSIGVLGQTAAGGEESPGVKGISTGTGGVGVRGVANVGNSTGVSGTSAGGTGVHGTSTSGDGVLASTAGPNRYGVYATNTSSGMALGVAGNAKQDRDKGGLVKAMIRVGNDGQISGCFNSQMQDGGASLPPSGNTGCGFSVERIQDDSDFLRATRVNFGFVVIDRFISATATPVDVGENIGINAFADNSTSVRVSMFFTDQREDTRLHRRFTIIVF